jgi:hypothetical protein
MGSRSQTVESSYDVVHYPGFKHKKSTVDPGAVSLRLLLEGFDELMVTFQAERPKATREAGPLSEVARVFLRAVKINQLRQY